jgi:hypothetical protein
MFEVVGGRAGLTNSVIPRAATPTELMESRASRVRTRVMEFRRHNGHWTVNGQTGTT